ncbi:MAG: hypothetical protein ACM3UL_04515, partial [Ignavibacteria bacterium]
IVAVLGTSFVWYVILANDQSPLFPGLNPNSRPTTTPTSTSHPTSTPTNGLTLTPKPTISPVTGTTNPIAPEFTLQYADHSYDVPPVYKTDPFTGQSVISQSGYHQDNRTIDVTIKNQPFTPSTFADGNVTELRYNARLKGHFEDWSTTNYSTSITEVKSTSGGYTVISFYIGGLHISPGGQIDVQVKALIGYHYYHPNECMGDYFVTLTDSGWSDTQTITIESNNRTPIP